MVLWVTGLSGAGKTTISHELVKILAEKKNRPVLLDGDILREVFGGSSGYSPEERKKLAMQYAHLCRVLAEQEFDVVCATISMFHDVRRWNRENIPGYKEIYLRVPIDILIERDQKQLYSRALRGEIEHVMGINTEFEEPDSPDFIIENSGAESPHKIAEKIFEQIFSQKKNL